MKKLKTLALAEAIAIVDPDSGTRAHDAVTQNATERFLQACRIVCAAARRAIPESVPLTLEQLESVKSDLVRDVSRNLPSAETSFSGRKTTNWKRSRPSNHSLKNYASLLIDRNFQPE